MQNRLYKDGKNRNKFPCFYVEAFEDFIELLGAKIDVEKKEHIAWISSTDESITIEDKSSAMVYPFYLLYLNGTVIASTTMHAKKTNLCLDKVLEQLAPERFGEELDIDFSDLSFN